MKQNRQCKIFWIDELKEYQVKLFINDIEQENVDCYTSNLEKARDMARDIEANTLNITEDFCKAEMKKQKERPEKQNIIKNEYPIYNIQTSEVIGWIELDEKELLPQEITIRDKSYQKE